MPQVNTELLLSYQAGINTGFRDFMTRSQDAMWQEIAMQMDTTLPTQAYAFLGNSAVMEEKTDEARRQRPNEFSLTISDKEFEARMEIFLREIEDDQYSLIMAKVRNLAEAATRHKNRLTFSLLASLFSAPCYDGQYFYDSDHQSGDSPVQNNVTNAPLSDNALQAAEAEMMLFTDDKGEPMFIQPDTLVVGPKLKRKAMDLTESEVVVVNIGDGTIGTGATAATNFRNYQKGKYRVIINPYIRGAAQYHWHLMDLSRGYKPVVMQNRSDVPVETTDNLLSWDARLEGKFNFKVRGRYNVAPGMWQVAYGSNASSG